MSQRLSDTPQHDFKTHAAIKQLPVASQSKEVLVPRYSDGLPTLLASPRQTCSMLNIGLTRCYELMNSGELESFKDGKSRKITVASIGSYVERKLGARK